MNEKGGEALNELRVNAELPAVSQGRAGTFTEHRPSNGLSNILERPRGTSPAFSQIRSFAEQSVLIGYIRVSKTDGSQTLDLQRDALLAAGVEPGHLYEDQTPDKRDNRFDRSQVAGLLIVAPLSPALERGSVRFPAQTIVQANCRPGR